MSSPFHSEGLSRAISEGGRPGVREWARNATDEELDAGLHTCHPTNEHTKIVQMEIDRRRSGQVDRRLAQIESDLAQVRDQMKRPEWVTWVFWFTLIGVTFGALSLLRDFLDLRWPASVPAHVEPATGSTDSPLADPATLSSPAPPASAPAPADTKATAPTSEPKSQ